MPQVPVALFAYKRPDHLSSVLEALRRNDLAPKTDLIVFSDGPRHEADVVAVTAVREIAHGASGFASLSVVEQESNLGLADSIINGVTSLLRDHESLIVLEDDLLTAQYFLSYMNEALEIYADDASVASIHAYCPPMRRDGPETFFLKGADCWGWATWRRAWQGFNPDGDALLTELKNRGLTWAFDLDGAFGYTSMLSDQVAQRNNSWAIRWYASMFLESKLTLYPGRSLVETIGADGTGTHVGAWERTSRDVSTERVQLQRIEIVEDPKVRRWYADGVARLGSRRRRLYRRLRGLLR